MQWSVQFTVEAVRLVELFRHEADDLKAATRAAIRRSDEQLWVAADRIRPGSGHAPKIGMALIDQDISFEAWRGD